MRKDKRGDPQQVGGTPPVCRIDQTPGTSCIQTRSLYEQSGGGKGSARAIANLPSASVSRRQTPVAAAVTALTDLASAAMWNQHKWDSARKPYHYA